MLQIYQQKQLERIWNSLDSDRKDYVRQKFGNLSEFEKLVVSEKQAQKKKI